MAITNKEEGVWSIDQVYNKQNQGSIWDYDGALQAWSWGDNEAGQLAQNNRSDRSSPVQIPGTTWKNASSRSYGNAYIAVKTDGTLWSWGDNGSGRLGHGNTTKKSSPVQVPGTTWANDSRGKFNCGFMTSQLIKTDGTLWSCGSGTYGGLGLNHNSPRSSPEQVPGDWKSVSSSNYTTIGVRTNGTLWWWGRNKSGSNGNNQGENTQFNSPKTVGSDTTWHEVQGDSSTFMGTKTDGTLWMWGANPSGGLGQNNRTQYSSPVQIPGTTWAISANKFQNGPASAAAIKTDGTLWMWGANNNNSAGVLGQNNQTRYSSPVQIPGTTWSTVSMGTRTVMGIKTDGTAWVWGENEFGGLGLNDVDVSRSSPTQIPGTNWFAGAKARDGGILFKNN